MPQLPNAEGPIPSSLRELTNMKLLEFSAVYVETIFYDIAGWIERGESDGIHRHVESVVVIKNSRDDPFEFSAVVVASEGVST